jgi:hypothetical protein
MRRNEMTGWRDNAIVRLMVERRTQMTNVVSLASDDGVDRPTCRTTPAGANLVGAECYWWPQVVVVAGGSARRIGAVSK